MYLLCFMLFMYSIQCIHFVLCCLCIVFSVFTLFLCCLCIVFSVFTLFLCCLCIVFSAFTLFLCSLCIVFSVFTLFVCCLWSAIKNGCIVNNNKFFKNLQENPPKLWLLPTKLGLSIEHGRRIDWGFSRPSI